jgi:hypothetical protein
MKTRVEEAAGCGGEWYHVVLLKLEKRGPRMNSIHQFLL